MRGSPYCTHNRLKRVFPWSVCTLVGRKNLYHRAKINSIYFTVWFRVIKLQEFLLSCCVLLELKIFQKLKEQISPFRHMLIYSEVCLIGHRYYSVKKVRLLNSSALSSAVCYWTQMFFCEKYVHSYKYCCLLGETDQTYASKSEKMEAPSII